jgi:hypothetical protein
MLDETVEAQDRRKLVELIRRKGGSVSPRDLMQCSRTYRTAEDAERALRDLVEAGFGIWENSPTTAKGGRPTRRFCLSDDAGVDRTPVNTEPDEGFVNVDAVKEAGKADRVNDPPAEVGNDDSDEWVVV